MVLLHKIIFNASGFLKIKDKVRIQDSIEVIRGATGTIKGRECVWEFVQQNWQELYQRYGTSTMLSRLVRVSQLKKADL